MFKYWVEMHYGDFSLPTFVEVDNVDKLLKMAVRTAIFVAGNILSSLLFFNPVFDYMTLVYVSYFLNSVLFFSLQNRHSIHRRYICTCA